MTGRIERPDEWQRLNDHQRRIRILEERPVGPGGGGDGCCDPGIVIPGAIVVAPEFQECLDITIEEPLEFSESLWAFTPAATDSGLRMPIGPYLCNYSAGFRLRLAMFTCESRLALYIQFYHLLGSMETAVGPPIPMVMPPGIITPTPYVSPPTVYATDPSGIGSLGDDWAVGIFVSQGSFLSTGCLACSGCVPDNYGILIGEYVAQAISLTTVVPQPTQVGQMLVSFGSPPVWTLLNPGTAGQVLTMSGGNPTWV